MSHRGRDRAAVVAALFRAGLELPAVTAPLADYQPAVRTPDTIYVAGQLPIVGSVVTPTGRVGADVAPAQATAGAQRAALAVIAAAFGAAAQLELLRPVKVTVFVAVEPSFTDISEVANGASAVFGSAFGLPHARSAVGVAALPRGAAVEVEAVFAVAGLG